MCAGSHRRYGAENKWLLDIGGCTILDRIKNQSGGISVVRKPHVDKDGICLDYKQTALLTDILTVTENDERSIILLGDVIYSDECIRQIFTYKGDIGFFYRKPEIFALVFSREYRHFLEKSLQVTNPKMKVHGKLWSLYQLYLGLPIGSKILRETPQTILIDDFTTDIDLKTHYVQFIESDHCKSLIDSGMIKGMRFIWL